MLRALSSQLRFVKTELENERSAVQLDRLLHYRPKSKGVPEEAARRRGRPAEEASRRDENAWATVRKQTPAPMLRSQVHSTILSDMVHEMRS